MSRKYAELTETEWTIIKAVWRLQPCSAPQVQQQLEKETGWTYSTVRTMMDRMISKGLLRGEKFGKVTFYQSVITRQQAQRTELLYALKHAFNGALTPMVQCLLETNKMSDAELAELESLIRAKKKGARKPK
jgi:BlaI family transcriptional regulator, penicillinase repressor